MKKTTALISITSALCLMLSACGGSAAATTAAPAQAPAATTTAAAAAEAPKQDAGFDFKGTVKILCDSESGTNEDLLCRAIASSCEEVSDATFIVENVPGGNSATAVQTLKSSKTTDRDMTILLESNSMALSMLQGTNPYKLEDIQIVSKISTDWYTVVTTTATGFKNWNDALEYIKAHPGELNWGCSGAKNNSNLFFSVLSKDADIDANYVSYSGTGKAKVGLVAGDVQIMAATSANLLDNLREEGTEYVPLLTNRPTNEFEGVDFTTCTEMGYETTNAITSSRAIYTDSVASDAEVKWLANILGKAVKTDSFKEFSVTNNIISDYMDTAEAEEWFKGYCETAVEMIPAME